MIRSIFWRALLVPLAVVALVVTVTSTTASAADLRSLISPPTHGGVTLKYAALGDSLAAGLGYGVGIGTDEDTICGRSPEAYAYRVADHFNATLAGIGIQLSPSLIACQGATTSDLLTPQTLGGATIQPQLDKAFDGGQPHLISLTSGANDVRWASFIGACFAASNCDTPENTAAVQAYIDAMKNDMKAALQSVRDRSSYFPPIVVATGYYTPVSAQCANPNFTPAEVAWVQNATASLNSAIQNASQGSFWFARFAPVDFTGHDICAADSWIQRPGETAPFHPTPRGQQAIAEAVLTAIGLR